MFQTCCSNLTRDDFGVRKVHPGWMITTKYYDLFLVILFLTCILPQVDINEFKATKYNLEYISHMSTGLYAEFPRAKDRWITVKPTRYWSKYFWAQYFRKRSAWDIYNYVIRSIKFLNNVSSEKYQKKVFLNQKFSGKFTIIYSL